MKQEESKNIKHEVAAAFRRLCVETTWLRYWSKTYKQPPSGGCVLKLIIADAELSRRRQPPSGGCVLKRSHIVIVEKAVISRLQAAVC